MQLKTWKWRIALSVADTLLTLGLSPQFYHGLLAFSFPFYFFVRCLNFVPSVFVVVTHIYQIFYHILGAVRPRTSYALWLLQFVNFLFWWWIGWKIDLKFASRDCGRGGTLADVILGFTLSLMVLFCSAARENVAVLQAARFGWGVALFCYSLLRLSQLWAMMRSPAAAT